MIQLLTEGLCALDTAQLAVVLLRNLLALLYSV